MTLLRALSGSAVRRVTSPNQPTLAPKLTPLERVIHTAQHPRQHFELRNQSWWQICAA